MVFGRGRQFLFLDRKSFFTGNWYRADVDIFYSPQSADQNLKNQLTILHLKNGEEEALKD